MNRTKNLIKARHATTSELTRLVESRLLSDDIKLDKIDGESYDVHQVETVMMEKKKIFVEIYPVAAPQFICYEYRIWSTVTQSPMLLSESGNRTDLLRPQYALDRALGEALSNFI